MTNPPDSGAEHTDRLASEQIPAHPSVSSEAESQRPPATWQPPESLPTWAPPVSEPAAPPVDDSQPDSPQPDSPHTDSPQPDIPQPDSPHTDTAQPNAVTADPGTADLVPPDFEPTPASSNAEPAWSPPAQPVDPPAWGSGSTQQRPSVQPPSAAPAPYGQGNYGQANPGQGNYGQANPGQGNYRQANPGLGTPSQSAYVGFEPTGQHQPVAPSSYGQVQPGYGAQSPAFGNPQFGGQHGNQAYGNQQNGGGQPYGSQSYSGYQYASQQYGSQQYGAQGGNAPYGSYSGATLGQVLPPAKNRSTKLIAGLVALVVILAAVAIVLVVKPDLFRTPKILDSSQVASDVSAQYEEQFQTQIKGFACDKSELVVEKGESYQCSATTDAGDPVNITITITDDQGAYTWKDDAQ